jgi:hypothetical protein
MSDLTDIVQTHGPLYLYFYPMSSTIQVLPAGKKEYRGGILLLI